MSITILSLKWQWKFRLRDIHLNSIKKSFKTYQIKFSAGFSTAVVPRTTLQRLIVTGFVPLKAEHPSACP